ncbi:MAG: NIL domain-containing protein [Acidimicrobiales bacterium]|jgi:ABC-type methionine transport system ATPase subunit
MTQRVKLIYPDQLVTVPVIAQLARDFDVLANIRRAAVDAGTGWIICELEGEAKARQDAVAWLVSLGVEVDNLGDVVES